MKRIHRLIVVMCLFLSSIESFAQTTYFTNSKPVRSGSEEARMYSLEIREDAVIVTIELKAVSNMKRMDYWCSRCRYLVYGGKEACDINRVHKFLLIKGYYVNGQIKKCGMDSKWGWDNVSAGETYYYKLYFEGHMPPGITTISVWDYGDPYWSIDGCSRVHGYSFYGYTINNPAKYTTNLTSENAIKQNINQNNDGYCGIYEEIGGSHFRLACVKLNGEYQLVFMSRDNYESWWNMGNTKAWLTKTPSGIMKCKWLMSDKSINNDVYAVFDGYTLSVHFPSNKKEPEMRFLKTYPENSPSIGSGGSSGNSGEWTGTGFALKNGYVVTNHHVVDGAKSIVILGVNGNTKTEYKATVVGVDKNNDLALLKINDSRFYGFNNVPYAVKNTTCEVGADIFVLGYPLTTYMGDEVKLTNGIISSRTGYQGDVSTYQISAPVQPGNSGGPMFDSRGNVVGIVNAGIPGAENVGYAIKTSYLYSLVSSCASTSIIPQTSSVTGTSLAEKVRQVKNCVFFIKCKGN